MYSPELEAEALKTLDDRNGSCVIAARKPGAVRPKTIYRWMRGGVESAAKALCPFEREAESHDSTPAGTRGIRG